MTRTEESSVHLERAGLWLGLEVGGLFELVGLLKSIARQLFVFLRFPK